MVGGVQVGLCDRTVLNAASSDPTITPATRVPTSGVQAPLQMAPVEGGQTRPDVPGRRSDVLQSTTSREAAGKLTQARWERRASSTPRIDEGGWR